MSRPLFSSENAKDADEPSLITPPKSVAGEAHTVQVFPLSVDFKIRPNEVPSQILSPKTSLTPVYVNSSSFSGAGAVVIAFQVAPPSDVLYISNLPSTGSPPQ